MKLFNISSKQELKAKLRIFQIRMIFFVIFKRRLFLSIQTCISWTETCENAAGTRKNAFVSRPLGMLKQSLADYQKVTILPPKLINSLVSFLYALIGRPFGPPSLRFRKCPRIFQLDTLIKVGAKSADTTSVFAIFAAIASRIKRAKKGLSKYRHDLFRP